MNIFKRNDKRLQSVNQNYIFFFDYKYRFPSVTKWRLTTEYYARLEEPNISSVMTRNCESSESQTLKDHSPMVEEDVAGRK